MSNMKIIIEIEASHEMTPEVLKSIGAALGLKPAMSANTETPVVELTKAAEPTKATKSKKSETTKDKKSEPESTPTIDTEPASEKDVQPEPDAEPEVTYTLEQVREKLASLSRAGKQAQVKALIEKHGASKLSEIKEEDYAALMQEAEGL